MSLLINANYRVIDIWSLHLNLILWFVNGWNYHEDTCYYDEFTKWAHIIQPANCNVDTPTVWCCSPREFIDCVAHIRVLSWLLIGSLTHTAVTKAAAVTVCQPLDLTASSYIADHIMVILTGFAEQSKVCCSASAVACCYSVLVIITA